MKKDSQLSYLFMKSNRNKIPELNIENIIFSSDGYPKITESLEIGTQGEDIVKLVLSKIAICYPFGAPQFGLDFLCQLKQKNQVTNKYFFVEVKTTKKVHEDQFTYYFEKTHLNLWCSSFVPVYIFFVNIKKRTIITWINIAETISKLDLPLLYRKIYQKKTNKIPVIIKSSYNSIDKILEPLILNINKHYEVAENYVDELLSLNSFKSNKIITERIPKELKSIENKLKNYYIKIPIKSRVSLIEVFFSTWERIDNRFGRYGYPTKIVQIALCTNHFSALAAGIKSLLYMDSDVLRWEEISTAFTYARDNIDINKRLMALEKAFTEFHLSPFAHSGHQTYLTMKIESVIAFLFTYKEIVQTYLFLFTNVYDKLVKKSDSLRKIRPCNKPNVYRSLELALFNVCTDEQLAKIRPEVPMLAADLYDNDVIIADKWRSLSWSDKAFQISLNTLYLYEIKTRKFKKMSKEAKELILRGINEHTDPRVRLDCLRVYNSEIKNKGKLIIKYIDELILKEKDSYKISNYKRVKYELEILIQNRYKDREIVEQNRKNWVHKY